VAADTRTDAQKYLGDPPLQRSALSVRESGLKECYRGRNSGQDAGSMYGIKVRPLRVLILDLLGYRCKVFGGLQVVPGKVSALRNFRLPELVHAPRGPEYAVK
jgi:hypothetical protein